MTFAEAVSLLQLALSLLIAASGPNVPPALEEQAKSIANYAITVANQQIATNPTLGGTKLANTPEIPAVQAPEDDEEEPSTGTSPNPAPTPTPTPDTEQDAPKITAKLTSASTHGSTGAGLKEALVVFEITSDASNVELAITPKITADALGAQVNKAVNLKYRPKGAESDYDLINWSKETVTLTEQNEPHVFEFWLSFEGEVLSFDYQVGLEVESYTGDVEPTLKGFPLTGSYSTCEELSHLHEIKVMCDAQQ